MINSNKKGFTLIELLVVVAIIGLLSSVVMVSLNSARSKARDAVRISDMRQIATALELYYSDFKSYPSLNACDNNLSWNSLETVLTPYISKLPKDPRTGTFSYCYKTFGPTPALIFYTENNMPNSGNFSNIFAYYNGSYFHMRYIY